MWYFAWILGLPLAVLFGILNAMWLDMHLDRQSRQSHLPRSQSIE